MASRSLSNWTCRISNCLDSVGPSTTQGDSSSGSGFESGGWPRRSRRLPGWEVCPVSRELRRFFYVRLFKLVDRERAGGARNSVSISSSDA
jgi:hypothetical protein